ncbi:hypothetical protein BDV26DRAFT_246188 [Aspergillus bertholletiae]|uniref:Zn(2)-C6 fungal-type domain-containing protein n=1 Tax=Aspergillus bertholletiae TaxID=1226010 RepID=A0A5N7B1V4_9EURO|nr:hypothetical protein BDV26DRAFT_246188 [Aspergillus bertholletiae]
MGYSGKPSSACGPCRARRAKCDRKRPRCTQCARKCITCSGYRELGSLLIRDETHAVAQKVQKPPCKGPESSSPGLIGPNGPRMRIRQTPGFKVFTRNESCVSAAEFVAAPRLLAQPLEELASTFFVNSYLPTSRFSFLLDHYYSFIIAKPMPTAVQAAALAYLHVEHPSHVTSRAAHRSYCTAITQINSALSNPSTAILDSTLVSVLLLGLFESLVFRDRYSVSSWAAHSHGALALLRQRGYRQLNSPGGRSLLSHISINVRSLCLLQSKPVPCDLLQLESENYFAGSNSNREFDINAILIKRLPDVLSATQNSSISTDTGLRLIEEAKDFEEQLVLICPSLESCINSYQNGLAPRKNSRKALKIWLIVQMLLLSINNTLRKKLLSLAFQSDSLGLCDASFFTHEAERTHENVKNIISDVLGAVPQFLDPAVEGAAMNGRYVLWLLAALANAECCQESSRTYILHQLRTLRERYNLQPAEDAARMLERAISPETWLLLCHLS